MTREQFESCFTEMIKGYEQRASYVENRLYFCLASCYSVGLHIGKGSAKNHYKKFLKKCFGPKFSTSQTIETFMCKDSEEYKRLFDFDYDKDLLELGYFLRALCLSQWRLHVLETEEYLKFEFSESLQYKNRLGV